MVGVTLLSSLCSGEDFSLLRMMIFVQGRLGGGGREETFSISFPISLIPLLFPPSSYKHCSVYTTSPPPPFHCVGRKENREKEKRAGRRGRRKKKNLKRKKEEEQRKA